MFGCSFFVFFALTFPRPLGMALASLFLALAFLDPNLPTVFCVFYHGPAALGSDPGLPALLCLVVSLGLPAALGSDPALPALFCLFSHGLPLALGSDPGLPALFFLLSSWLSRGLGVTLASLPFLGRGMRFV